MKIFMTGAHTDKFALVDADAPALVFEANWSLNSNGYAKTNIPMGDGRFTTVMMHRVVLGAKKGQVIDHINRNPLDNRRENLRFVTMFQNARNKEGRLGMHGYKGVSKSSRSLGYAATIRVNGRSVYLGTFPTPEAAALAYNDKLIEMDGDLALINDVDESDRQPSTKELRHAGLFAAGKTRGSLGYWGVTKAHGDKYAASYRGEYLGCHTTVEGAARAYDVRAKSDGYYRVNFPE